MRAVTISLVGSGRPIWRSALVLVLLTGLPALARAQSSVSITASPTFVPSGATVTLSASITPTWNQDCGYGCAVISAQGYLQISGSNGYDTSTPLYDLNGGTLPGSDAGPGQTMQPVSYTASGGYHYDLCYYQPGYEFYGCVNGYGSYDESGSANVSVAPAIIPSAVSVSPASGTGARQLFTFQYSSSAGANRIGQTWQIFHPSGQGNQSCVVGLYHGTGNDGTFVLWGDVGWEDQQSAQPNTPVVLENSQCRLHMATTSIVAAGDVLAVVVDVSFKAAYAGTKAVTMYGYSEGGYGPPAVLGAWTVPTLNFTADSVTPNTGEGRSQPFALRFTSNYGPSDLYQGWFWINQGLAQT
jgi:hypothetical protein